MSSLAGDLPYAKTETSQSYNFDRSSSNSSNEAISSIPYAIGTQVDHPKFGSGVVIQRDGKNEDLKIVVFFKQAGKKTLVAKYASLITV